MATIILIWRIMIVEIDKIIQAIPSILQYFVPGYVFLKIWFFLRRSHTSDQISFITLSVVISFFIITLVDTLDAIILPDIYFLEWSAITVYVLVAVVFSFAFYKILLSPDIKNIFAQIFGQTYNKGIWKDVIDYSGGTLIFVYLKSGVIYTGNFNSISEDPADSWLTLKGYRCKTLDGVEYDSTTEPYPSLAVINLRDVDRMEVIYDKDSKVPPKMNYADGGESQ
jgi:hypothetical protein